MDISTFLNTELVNFSSYSTLRSIPSYVDGLKNSSRKIVYSAIKYLNKEMKVSTFAGMAQTYTQYLHGDISGSIISLGRNFCGSNNLQLLKNNGNFGTRMFSENSATRYIFTQKTDYFDSIFLKIDNNVLISQQFEGEEIEPRFYTPTIPLILINGGNGIATGFATKILPRDTFKVIKYLKAKLDNTNCDLKLLLPSVNGFKGSIKGDINSSKGEIYGVFKRINSQKKQIEITEIPLGYDLKSYIEVLDKLEDKGIIKKYQDLSDNDNFHFILHVDSNFLKKSDDEIYNILNLKKAYVENYTLLDEDNKIKEFSNTEEIIDAFIKIKLEYLNKRKLYKLQKLKDTKDDLKSILRFINLVLDDIIDFKKHSKEYIYTLLDKDENILSKGDSYEYLMNLKIVSFTQEKIKELKNNIKKIETEYKELEIKSVEKIWIDDLDNLLNELCGDF